MNITFVGASHLSVCNAIVADKFNFSVNIIDLENLRFNKLKENKLDLKEPGVEEYLELKTIEISSNFQQLKKSNLIFLSLDVSVDSSGKSDLSDLDALVEQILNNINSSSTLIIMSQVNPGYSRKIHKKFKNTFYQMETLVFGNALDRALNQERIVIGKSNLIENLTSDYYEFLDKFNCPVLQMKFEEAEFTKQCANVYLATSISITNSLSEICETNDLSWSRISAALKLDSRIGEKAYLKAGLGIGGSNILRDITNVIENSQQKLNYSDFFKEILVSSQYYNNWICRNLIKIKNSIDGNLNIGVLGVTYKENIASVIGSGTYKAITKYAGIFNWKIYDPIYKLSIDQYNSPEDVFVDSNVVIIGNNDKRYRQIIEDNIKKCPNLLYILDPFNVCDQLKISDKVVKLAMGEGNH